MDQDSERVVGAPARVSGLQALSFGTRFLFDPLAATREIHAAFGPFAALQVELPIFNLLKVVPFGLPLILTVGATYNREALNNSATWRGVTIFRGGPRNSAARRLGKGLVRMTGRRHAHYRRLFAQPLRKANVESLGDAMGRIADEEVASWPMGQTLDLRAFVYRLVRALAIDLMFGGDRKHGFPIADKVSGLLEREWSLSVAACPINLPITPYGRMLRGAEVLERDIIDWADTRRGRADERDLLSIVVNNAEEDGKPASDATIVGHVPQLFGATFETCQNALTSTLVLLAQHPHVARDLLDELRGKLAGAAPVLDNIADLPLLDAVAKESLRLLPPVPLQMRAAERDATLAGVAVPKGTRVVLNAFLTNRLPDLYPAPDRFRPERWMTINPTPFEFLVFSAGPRTCAGYWLALGMIKVAVASILARYRVGLVPQADVNYQVRPALSPAAEIPVILHRQDGAFAAAPIQGNIHGLVQFAR